ncbi:copper amine oxidase N-terminal domain-containing protein [Paenibacillus rhizophilus]|uniref:Copper amine oxidase N-terminal domain-containing protein n=1 Tax=Paenibacillus rhizophilus TaxID=1850366 RepID=A0A3N9NZ57_9BACL|nr:copper amine oxidase N-terminal domain-containing protein [Paenibacillus rhizophilus]RQW09193.1 copper amine oxidase N-terminal domain-containing protein [Paenibacillus rhizophilus]
MRTSRLAAVVLAAALGWGASTAFGAEVSPILLNYKNLDLASKATVSAGTTWVPLKTLAIGMGYSVVWNQASKTAVLTRPGRQIAVTAGSKAARVNGTAFQLAKPVRIAAGTVQIPLVSGTGALGGKIAREPGSGSLSISDETRFTTAAVPDMTYWVSQHTGEVYASRSASGKPALLGKLPLIESPYMHNLEIKTVAGGTHLLVLSDNHYAMFNNFSNVYQALIRDGKIVKQMDFHLMAPAYSENPKVASTQLYMSGGDSVQYINGDGSLGKLYDIEALTGQSGAFTVEYAAPDTLIIRFVDTSHLYLIHTGTDAAVNLNKEVATPEDWKDWEKSDGRDPYVLARMLILTKRSGNHLTLTYRSLADDKSRTVTYSLSPE